LRGADEMEHGFLSGNRNATLVSMGNQGSALGVNFSPLPIEDILKHGGDIVLCSPTCIKEKPIEIVEDKIDTLRLGHALPLIQHLLHQGDGLNRIDQFAIGDPQQSGQGIDGGIDNDLAPETAHDSVNRGCGKSGPGEERGKFPHPAAHPPLNFTQIGFSGSPLSDQGRAQGRTCHKGKAANDGVTGNNPLHDLHIAQTGLQGYDRLCFRDQMRGSLNRGQRII